MDRRSVLFGMATLPAAGALIPSIARAKETIAAGRLVIPAEFLESRYLPIALEAIGYVLDQGFIPFTSDAYMIGYSVHLRDPSFKIEKTKLWDSMVGNVEEDGIGVRWFESGRDLGVSRIVRLQSPTSTEYILRRPYMTYEEMKDHRDVLGDRVGHDFSWLKVLDKGQSSGQEA